MSWKVLITAHAPSVEAVGGEALRRLQEEGCQVIHPPKYGPLTEAELLPQLVGIDAVVAGMDPFNATVPSFQGGGNVEDYLTLGSGHRCGGPCGGR